MDFVRSNFLQNPYFNNLIDLRCPLTKPKMQLKNLNYMTWLDKILTKGTFVLDYRVIERPVSSIGETELEKRSLHKMIFLPLKLRKTVRLPGH